MQILISCTLCFAPTCRGTREQAMVHGHWARQDADLSYMNQPAITTMLLVAGFSSLTTHFLSWAQLAPPASCLDKMFVTPDGVTIDQQVDKLTQVWVPNSYALHDCDSCNPQLAATANTCCSVDVVAHII